MEPTATPEAAASTNGKSGEASGPTVEVHNPATGKLIGTVPAMGPDEVAGWLAAMPHGRAGLAFRGAYGSGTGRIDGAGRGGATKVGCARESSSER